MRDKANGEGREGPRPELNQSHWCSSASRANFACPMAYWGVVGSFK